MRSVGKGTQRRIPHNNHRGRKRAEIIIINNNNNNAGTDDSTGGRTIGLAQHGHQKSRCLPEQTAETVTATSARDHDGIDDGIDDVPEETELSNALL
mmetsp:Transcript_17394/g.39703  ORF Transcript_17394/g.39703 Transcript_17394/m.39703 type:complete len:97 (-) Transcript_17394:222-512(-)